VFAATLAELAAGGYENLSIERIARAADVNKTSVYRRWPTREALVAAALERVLDDVHVELADTGTLRGDLLSSARSVARLLSTQPGRALAVAAMTAAGSPELVDMARRRLALEEAGPMAAMVQRAIARREWREDVDARVALSMLAGAILHRSLLEGADADDAWLEAIVDVLACGVAHR
jgi:AcrR family transcriptional regulator